MLLTATWTVVVSLLLSLSVSSCGSPEYEQKEKGHSQENGEMGILVTQGQAGGWLFPEPGLLAT